eukprot:10482109-Alexandrium_andersonii.AAC.1
MDSASAHLASLALAGSGEATKQIRQLGPERRLHLELEIHAGFGVHEIPVYNEPLLRSQRGIA